MNTTLEAPLIDQDVEILKQIGSVLTDIQRNISQATSLFSQLSSEGVRKSKIQFKGVLSATMIDKIVAAGKIGYPSFMILKSGIQVSTWRLLEPEAKEIALNKNATVNIKTSGNRPPIIKTVENLTGPEINQVFKPKYKGAVPLDKQIPIPPVIQSRKNMKNTEIEDIEITTDIVASGTEYIILNGNLGGKMKCRLAMLRKIIK